MKHLGLLLVALLMGGVAAFVYQQSLTRALESQPTISVLRLAEDVSLAAGDSVTPAMLEAVPLPQRYAASYEGIFKNTPEDRSFLDTLRAVEFVEGGSFLLYRHFVSEPATRFDALIDRGKRALSLSVDSTNAVGFFIVPGSWIDVVGVLRSESDVQAEPILSAVRVLAIDRHTTVQDFENSSRRSYNTITIEVTPEQLNRYLLAQTRLASGLAIVLRNACGVPEAKVRCDR